VSVQAPAGPEPVEAEGPAGTLEQIDTWQRVKTWDWPIRLVHWSFVLLMPGLWWTWKSGRMETHQLLGHIILALLVFRLFWGFAGSSTARFGAFVKGPRAVAAYVSSLFGKSTEPVVGHNPLGALSVILLLGLLIVEVALGLVTQDVDGLESGPLSQYVSYEFSDGARYWHDLVFNLLLGFIALHVVAVLFYLAVKRDNLVTPMVTGHRPLPPSVPAPVFAPLWRFALGAAIAAGFAWWVSLGCPF
jgi:cytochrome b